MTTLKLSPNALGSGQFTIAAPNSNSTRTMTLADSDGTIYIAPGDGIQALAGGIPAARTITAGTGVTVTNGNGVSGNPTITNTGVTSVTAGSNISVSASTGGVTISSTAGAPTTAQVLSATAGANVGEVGTYAFLQPNNSTIYSAGSTLAGSSLTYNSALTAANASAKTLGSGTASGTWRAMGYRRAQQLDSCGVYQDSSVSATLWLRIS